MNPLSEVSFDTDDNKTNGLLLNSRMALRADAKRGDPPRDEVRRGNECASSPRTQIAKQKRSAGGAPTQSTFSKDACLQNLIVEQMQRLLKRSMGRGVGEQYSVRPPDEDALWQSEVSLKGASGGRGHASALSPTCVMEALLKIDTTLVMQEI
ncbi:MAG: hypothetical protein ACM3JI_03120 [Anaerolineae bacterium]